MMQPPLPGETTAILPDLHWVRMPLPFPPHHVNCWLLRDGDGWLLIDAGARVAGAQALWDSIFASTLGGAPVTRMLATHFHYDHVGLAGWMCDRWQAPLVMSRTEYLLSRMLLAEDPQTLKRQQQDLGRRAGAPDSYLEYLENRQPLFRTEVTPLPPSFQRLRAGDALRIGGRDWLVRIGQGHAPEMVCLYCAELGVLVGADQILPRISPYIGVMSWEVDGDPLADFLTSNHSFLDLPEDTLVLPSHGDPFTGLHSRIAWLDEHHAERLGTLAQALATPMTAYEASRVLFPRVMEDNQISFVLGEGMAHLHRLMGIGAVVRDEGDDGVALYRHV
jgi:glyoxylase-like metal-dependent hydrolase (beta-lactamase superfamily II)